MKPLLRYLLLALFVFPLGAQPPATPSHVLREHLNHRSADTARVMQLLNQGQFYQCKVGEKAQDLDSALLLARQAVALSQSLKFYEGEGRGHLLLAKSLREKGALDQGRRHAAQALAIAQKYGYADLSGHVYSEFTRYYSNTGADVASKIRLNEQALAFLVRAGNRRKEADVLKDQGDLHQLQENYRQSLRELHRALALYRSVQHPDVQGVYDLLGFVSTKTGDYKSGLAYGLRAVKTAQQRGDTSLYLCTIYNRLGLTYHALGQLTQAHNYFKLSLSVARKYHHVPSIVYLSGNISAIFLSMGKPGQALSFLRTIADHYAPADSESRIILATRLMDAYGRLGHYEQAQSYCDQVLELVEKYGAGSPGLAAVYQSVIGFLLDSRQYDEARKYLRINQLLCQQQGSAGSLAGNHLQWFRLDSSLRSYPSAIAHYQRYVALRDSLLTESKSQQMAQLEIQYQTEKKDQELRFKEKNIQLLTERSRLQAQQLAQARMIRNGSIAGALMLVGLLGLGYNRYRLKQQSNGLLEAKQREINEKNRSLERVLGEKEGLLEEKEWMLKEIHHRVRNNLQIVISLLSSQAANLSDDSALSTIRESQHRVQAMALIHQKLYQSEKVARVDMASYINDLVVYLRDAYQRPGLVRLNLSVQPLELDVTLAVPLGLIINEAVTNALKYAFPGDRPGTVTLGLTPVGGARYELRIDDDGVGLPPGYDPSRSRSLGMTLLHGLSEQLEGTLAISGPPGVSIRLTFRDEILGTTYSGADQTYRWHRPFSAPALG